MTTISSLEKICQSLLNLKIIAFFYENPSTLDTSRGIAAWLNYERKQIKQALDYLVSQNILIPHRIGSATAYALTQDKETIKRIEKFLLKKLNKQRKEKA